MAVKVPVLGFLLRLPASSPSSALALDEEGAPPAADTVCTGWPGSSCLCWPQGWDYRCESGHPVNIVITQLTIKEKISYFHEYNKDRQIYKEPKYTGFLVKDLISVFQHECTCVGLVWRSEVNFPYVTSQGEAPLLRQNLSLAGTHQAG